MKSIAILSDSRTRRETQAYYSPDTTAVNPGRTRNLALAMNPWLFITTIFFTIPKTLERKYSSPHRPIGKWKAILEAGCYHDSCHTFLHRLSIIGSVSPLFCAFSVSFL